MDRIKLLLLMLLQCSHSLMGVSKDEFAFDKDWPYQDLWINEEIIFKGCGPDCPARYEALRPLLNKFQRPFTVLEVGANNGYFCFRIANEYDATCIMIDGTNRLKKICEANTAVQKVIYLQKYVDSNDLIKLAETEHFDVVLCFHVLHHVDWRPFFAALQKLGDHVVIETPPVNDGFVSLKPTIPEIAQYLLHLPNGVQIGSFTRQTPEIKDHMILFSLPCALSYWTYSHRQPGISLQTFYDFNGSYPNISKREDAKKWILKGRDLIVDAKKTDY